MRATLGDFGLAMQMPKPTKGKSFVSASIRCGTEGYIAPGFHRGEMGPKLDVYAFGVGKLMPESMPTTDLVCQLYSGYLRALLRIESI